MANKKQKEITIKDLAILMKEGFAKAESNANDKFVKTEKNTDNKIDDLAGMMQREFATTRKEFLGEFSSVKKDIKEIKMDIKALKSEAVAMRCELHDLKDRVESFSNLRLVVDDIQRRMDRIEAKIGL
ncbi:MAG: hypothetical protein ABH822_00700 [Patescibacteria group bacterium]